VPCDALSEYHAFVFGKPERGNVRKWYAALDSYGVEKRFIVD
jgi:hypothetical protein